MGDEQSHATMIGNPVQFLFPDVDIFFLHENKQQKILGKRIGEFDISPFDGPGWEPKRERSWPHPSGWGSKGSVSKVEASYSMSR